MDSATSNCKRTPSRCREWERKRRNKFNDAISKLGEIVKNIHNANCPGKNLQDVQYPKIEIVEKAIVCLTNSAQENTQLKAEILALQVKLESVKNKKNIQKDASTQVYFGRAKKRKCKDSKYMKVVMKKSTVNIIKEKSANELKDVNKLCSNGNVQRLPTLLPKSYLDNKKGSENTIVVLPAAPYIFPQRSLLFPSVPPAIVLVDSNLQTLNKSPISIINRNTDITKTTMVNILPISAYSRPLSASKTKRTSGAKSKKENVKTTTKKANVVFTKKSKHLNNAQGKLEVNAKENVDACNTDIENTKDTAKELPPENNIKDTIVPKPCSIENNGDIIQGTHSGTINKASNGNPEINKPKVTEKEDKVATPPIVTLSLNVNSDSKSKDEIVINKDSTLKENTSELKEKESKLPPILESTLCDNVVDGGNARLELAEEFLATSPTAAFLMSFPLVSGNRADSPAEESQNIVQPNTKDNHRRNELIQPSMPYYEKTTNTDKSKTSSKLIVGNSSNKTNDYEQKQEKCSANVITKVATTVTTTNSVVTKSTSTATPPNITHENPFLHLSMPSIITNCSLPDTSFNLDLDCNISKTITSHSSSYANSNNFFYKSDPFGTVKNSIYSTSNISSSHEFNGLGLYPCAMEKYASKNKSDYSDDNLMKMGSSRLTYDIDLGWSHKGFDFVNCTTAPNTFSKDNILTTTSTPYTSSYNPFNPDFHIPLVTSGTRKDTANKATGSFADTISSFYSQPTSFWSEEGPFYTNSNMSRNISSKPQNYPILNHTYSNVKHQNNKQYETKISESGVDSGLKPTNNITTQQITKKSPSKMHINWMTSEIRPLQNNCNSTQQVQIKENHKPVYNQLDQSVKKLDQNESNYFPIPIHNFPPQPAQEEFHMWPTTRALGTTEISIEPPPINLPTLVGDLALGPHDKKKTGDVANRLLAQADIQNCGNFLSVAQLMNRTSDNMASRYHAPNIDPPKSVPVKQSTTQFNNDNNRKSIVAVNLENNITQPYYAFNDTKITNSYESVNQFPHPKVKSNNKPEKASKSQKNNYSTEALLRGANCTQKGQDNTKFMMPPQKYIDYNTSQDTSVAQVSHFPPILDYSDNSYASQQFSGTTLYNTTTNTISNSFYSNFMPGNSNLMSSNYTAGPFTGDIIDYNQPDCNYTSHKYEELKMRNNTSVFQPEKVPSNYKSSRRESTSKHKLECSKKESSKKYQSKKPKIANDMEEWHDSAHLLWQNKTSSKKHPNLVAEELPFPNYVGNQMTPQYQGDYFNSHLMPGNIQNMSHNADRTLANFPVTSRANFNLSTIFPEITMKVQ